MNLKIIIVIFIFSIAIYFIILGYKINSTNYSQEYIKTVGKIIKKKIESEDIIEKKKNSNEFKHGKKFRIKITYRYKVLGKEYTGTYYNDGINTKFLKEDEYIPIGKTYNYVKFINIFYNKENPHDNCIKLEEIQNRKKKIFYLSSAGLFFLIPFIIFY
jgi:hypothetical protein